MSSNQQSAISLTADVRKWYNDLGVKFFNKINVQEKHSVLDFGCRVGNYTIPVAEVVGEMGKVYALDVDQQALDELLSRAKRFSLNNIITIKTQGELKTTLPSNSIDIVLFYDVIHSICKEKGSNAYIELVKEFRRILKKGGLLTVMFGHLNTINTTEEEVIEKTEKYLKYTGFLKSTLVHWDNLEEGTVYLFEK